MGLPRAFATLVLEIRNIRCPVGLVPVVREQAVSLTFVHAGCGAKLVQRRYCPDHDQLVDPETARAVEVADGQLVELADDDLATLAAEKTTLIRTRALVDTSQLELQVEKRYLLLPNVKVGMAAYATVVAALHLRPGKGLLVELTVREYAWTAVVRPHGRLLLLEKLHPSEDTLDLGPLLREIPETVADDTVAAALLDRVRVAARPPAIVDERRAKLRALVSEKLAAPKKKPRARAVRAG